jgi:hypothetical protein
LDFAQARYYANSQGRFTSPDPLLASGKAALPQSWNRYTYTLNNPLAFIDPSGLIWGRKTDENGNQTGNPIWYKDEQAMKAKGASAFTPKNWKYETADGSWVSLNPNGPGSTPDYNLNPYSKPEDDYYKSGWSYVRAPDAAPDPEMGLETDWNTQFLITGLVQSGGSLAARGISNGIARAFVTNESEAVFFSTGMRTAAEAEIEANGGKLITDTLGGKALSKLDRLPETITRPLWDFGSRKFAQGASGTARVAIDGFPSTSSTFVRRELFNLYRNPNVQTIKTIGGH